LLAALVLWPVPSAPAQSSSSQPSQTTSPVPQTSGNGTYVSVNPLAGVRYDNKYDISVGMAYDHMKAGPTLLQGSNLGGLDFSGSWWFSKRWAVQTSERFYLGTSGAGINSAGPNGGPIKGPFVAQYFFTAGPEWLGPHNQHGAILAHLLVGGVYGQFEKSLLGKSPQLVDFYNDQVAPAAIIGGHFGEVDDTGGLGSVDAKKVAALDPFDQGHYDPSWKPNILPAAGLGVWGVLGTADALYLGGDFTQAKGEPTRRFAQFPVGP